MCKTPLVPPRMRHFSAQEKSSTSKKEQEITPRRSSTPGLKSTGLKTFSESITSAPSKSSTSFDTSSPIQIAKKDSTASRSKKTVSYVSMAGNKSPSSGTSSPSPGPPLVPFPIHKSGSLGSASKTDAMNRYGSFGWNSEGKKQKENRCFLPYSDELGRVKEPPLSKQELIEKFTGKLPSIPSAETIESEGQQDDKEVVDFFANSDNMGRSTPGIVITATNNDVDKKDADPNEDLKYSDDDNMLSVEGKSEVYKPDKGSVTDLRSRNNSGESSE